MKSSLKRPADFPTARRNALGHHLWSLALVFALLLSARPLAAAETEAALKVDGTWKWTFTMSDGTKTTPKAKLKREGSTVTGTSISRPGYDAAITEGQIQGEDVSWVVVREQDGRKVTTRYRGKLQGNTIKGQIESDWAGEMRRYDWEAQRAPETIATTWRWDMPFGGRRVETKATFKLEGEKLTGKVLGRTGGIEIQDGQFKAGEVAFSVVRERDGSKFATHYKGKYDGDTIKGEVLYDWGEEKRTRDWIATRADD